MNTKKILSFMLAAMIGLFSAPSYARLENAGMPDAGMPQIDISPDQMQKMESMMHEMQHFYESLPPEEQAQFELELASEVEKEQQKLETMNPAERQQYIETAFRSFDDIDLDELIRQIEEEEGTESNISQEDINTAAPSSDDKADKAQDDLEKKQKIKAAIDTIDSIIKLLDSFAEKMSGVRPSARDLIGKWITKGYIPRWAGADSNWDRFETDLNEMKQRLHKLKETDPTTNKYYYLDDIKKTEKTVGQLDMLLATIKKYEPNIEISADGKVKNELAKSALKRLFNYLVDTTKTITTSIGEIVGEFEKKGAPKLAKEEEQKRKKAEQYKKPRRPSRAKEAGTPDKPDSGGYGYDWGSDVDTNYGNYGSSSYDPGYSDYGSSDYGYSPSADKPDSASTSKNETPSTGGPTSAGKADEKKDDSLYRGTPSVTDYSKALKNKYPTLAPKIESKKTGIESNLTQFDEAWEGITENWKTIQNYLSAAEENQAIKAGLLGAASGLSNAANKIGSLNKQLKEKVKESDLKTGYAKEIKDAIESRKEELNKIKMKVKTLNEASVHESKKDDFTTIQTLAEAATTLLKNIEKK